MNDILIKITNGDRTLAQACNHLVYPAAYAPGDSITMTVPEPGYYVIRLDDAMNQAEAAMRQDKQAYYARNGQERQLRGLNEKLEQTLTEKRDAEHFLRVLAPKYKSVFVVDLKTDRMRGVIVPDYFQKILDTSGGSFLAVLQQYRDTQVQPAYRESLADLLDYNYIRSKVLTGDIVEHTYKKTDDTTFRVKVTPYSRSGSHIDETLWIFSDEGASLTPPQTK